MNNTGAYAHLSMADMRTPFDWKEVQATVYVKNLEIVILGTPIEDSDHNCDNMGCSSLNHVLFRGTLEDGNQFSLEADPL